MERTYRVFHTNLTIWIGHYQISSQMPNQIPNSIPYPRNTKYIGIFRVSTNYFIHSTHFYSIILSISIVTVSMDRFFCLDIMECFPTISYGIKTEIQYYILFAYILYNHICSNASNEHLVHWNNRRKNYKVWYEHNWK